MPPFLILIVFGLGILVNLVAAIWNLVLCGRQGIGWLLAVIFVPFASLVFLVKFWSEAKRPFFLGLAGSALTVSAVLLNPQAFPKDLANRFAPRKAAASQPPAVANVPAASLTLSEVLQREQAALAETERRQRLAQETRSAYEKHRADVDALFKDLNARRAKLKVDDARAVAAFNADAARYAALLEQTRVEHDALEPGLPVAPAVDAPSKAPAPPTVKRGPVYVPGVVGGNPQGTKPEGIPPNGATSLPRRALDKARVARDAASAAEDAGPFAGEVYGTTAPGVAPAPSPRR